MSAIVVEFPSGYLVRPGRYRRPDRVRLHAGIAECVASLSLEPPDHVHRAVRSALRALLDVTRRQPVGGRRAS